jgi:hypothetical protein
MEGYMSAMLLAKNTAISSDSCDRLYLRLNIPYVISSVLGPEAF